MTHIPEPSADPCGGKQRFATFADADRQAWFAMARRRNADHDSMLAAYFCPRCNVWHVGNPHEQSAGRWSASLA